MSDYSRDTLIPYIQVRNNSAILYSRPSVVSHRRNQQFCDSGFLNMKYTGVNGSETYTGRVTAGSRKNMARVISLLVQSTPYKWIINPVTAKKQKFKLNFITLTVSSTDQMLTAKEAHKALLEPMLQHFRNVYGMKSYIWKAELQKRGQIHYHITSDTFIHYEAIQKKWNSLQKKRGLLEGFASKYGHYNPNSTDVHSVYKMQNIEAYLVKYLGKHGGPDKAAAAWVERYSKKRTYQTPEGYWFTELPPTYFNHVQLTYTKGKIWDCSFNLKHGKYFTAVEDNINYKTIEAAIADGKARIEHKDHFSMIFFTGGMKAIDILHASQRADYYAHMEAIRNYSVTAARRKEPQPVPEQDPVPLLPKPKPIQTKLVFRVAS